MICTLHQILLESEMGGHIARVGGWRHLLNSVNLENLGVDGRITLNARWIILAQDWDKWRAVVNTVMNLRVPYNAENLLTG